MEEFMEVLEKSRNKQPVWNSIAQVMSGESFTISGKQVEQKWNNLKRSYRNAVQYENGSGNNTTSFPYIDKMGVLLGDDPATKPLYTKSSTGQASYKEAPGPASQKPETNNASEDSDEDAGTSSGKGKKRKRSKKKNKNEELMSYLEERDDKMMAQFAEFHKANLEVMSKLVEKM